MTLKEQAIEYAKMGWQVFPLLPRTKKPATPHGFQDASNDVIRVAEWWNKNPNYNIGIATGKASGFLVVDLDIDEEKGKNGAETLREWERENGKLPDTWQSITGRGGYHFLYKCNEPFSNKANFHEGIDIRADGGYIVAPPSLHPNGNRYEWEYFEGDGVELAEVNDTVRKLLNPPKREYSGFVSPPTIEDGSRTNILTKMACSMQAKGFDDETIKGAIRSENDRKCNPPLTEKELEREVFPALKRYEKGNAPFQVVCDNGKARPVKQQKKLNYKSARELLESDAPPIEYVVDVIIAKGLIVLSAKSKMGKSWLALQLAVAVASGEDFLGFNTQQGGVLYIDLENAEPIARSRLATVLNGSEPPDKLTVINDYSTMNDTFITDISEYLEEHKDTSLVIVDVFQRVKKSKKANQSDYDDIYQNFTPLKELTEKYNISLILVMHNRKAVDLTDPYSNVLGSTAIMGASDEMIVIHKKERRDENATLSVTGRTVQENEYTIHFNKPLCKWEMLGDSEVIAENNRRKEYEASPIVKTIKKLVETNGGRYTGTVSEIIKASVYIQGGRIYDSATKCGIALKKYIPMLEKYDAIEHFTPKNGNASSTHEFKKMFV